MKSSNLRHYQAHSQNKGLSVYRRRASRLQTDPFPARGREAGGQQPETEGKGQTQPQRGILYQTVSGLLVANRVFLGSWMVDICQEGHSQRSAPQRRCTAHLRPRSCCAPGKLSSWDRGGDKTHRPTWGECACQAPGHPSCSDLGRAQNAGPTESAPLWSTREAEPQRLRPGKCTQPRAHLRQFSCRATWSLSSVVQESTDAMSGGKPSVAQTLRALPTHASDVCLPCSSLLTAQLNK